MLRRHLLSLLALTAVGGFVCPPWLLHEAERQEATNTDEVLRRLHTLAQDQVLGLEVPQPAGRSPLLAAQRHRVDLDGEPGALCGGKPFEHLVEPAAARTDESFPYGYRGVALAPAGMPRLHSDSDASEALELVEMYSSGCRSRRKTATSLSIIVKRHARVFQLILDHPGGRKELLR